MLDRMWNKGGLTSCVPSTGLLAEDGGAEVDELHDAVVGDDDVLELQVAVCEAGAVEVVGAC